MMSFSVMLSLNECVLSLEIFVFFFKQRTAYELRISDWSSDVCSSDLKRGDTVLVHAAAGGVGSILVPWLKAIGATVIAHAGSAKKAERAGEFGADHALSGSIDGLAAQVRTLTDGEGVAVVFDGVGAASWTESLASVAKRGLLVTYGNASGPVPRSEEHK